MRIAHLVSSGQLGGTEASVLEMVTSVLGAQPSWQLPVTTPEHGAFERRLQQQGLAVEVLAFPRRFAAVGEAGRAHGAGGVVAGLLMALPGILAYRGRLRRSLSAGPHPPDIVHAHGFKMQVLAAMAARSRTPLVWHLHDYVAARPVSARLLRRFAPRASVMIANSTSVADDMRRVCGPACRIETIYNGVDLTTFSPDGPQLDLDARAGLPPAAPGTLRIGLVGTFGVWKGQKTFLSALARMTASRPVRGYLIGGAQYQTGGSQLSEADLRGEATRLGIADRVGFTGPVTEPAAAMRALDIVVHASTQPEPFGMVIAEAMGCARPVVISGAGGASELVTDGIDGLSHTPGNVEELAARLDRLAEDDALRARLGAAARATAERRFDCHRLAEQLVPLYRDLIR
ncbi:MAG TPA: glycosyltransferase family 4 protein [Vicinamibacterales bacterium]